MFKEILDVLQDDPFGQRRWFHDDFFDLFVRYAHGKLAAFELCYGIGAEERALVWNGQGYFHDGAASDGFIGAGAAGGSLAADPIIARFERAANGLPRALRLEIEAHLSEYVIENAAGASRRSRFRRAEWQRPGGEKEDRKPAP